MQNFCNIFLHANAKLLNGYSSLREQFLHASTMFIVGERKTVCTHKVSQENKILQTKFLVGECKILSVQMQCFLWVCKTFASNQSFPAERKMFDCKQIVPAGYSRGETGSICSSLYSETNKTSEQEHNNQLNTT